MTELSFLLDLLMNHKLPKLTKQLIAARIKEVEQMLQTTSVTLNTKHGKVPVYASPYIKEDEKIFLSQEPSPIPVEEIAQTPAAAAALASRQQAIMNRGTIEKGQTSPRKW